MKRSAALTLLFVGRFGALFYSGEAARVGGSKKVTVTLVRWPYT